MDNYRCTYTETAGATTIKTGAGVLKSVVVGTTSGKVIEIYDSAGSGGTKIGELKASISENTYKFNCGFSKGLHIVNTGGGKISVIWR